MTTRHGISLLLKQKLEHLKFVNGDFQLKCISMTAYSYFMCSNNDHCRSLQEGSEFDSPAGATRILSVFAPRGNSAAVKNSPWIMCVTYEWDSGRIVTSLNVRQKLCCTYLHWRRIPRWSAWSGISPKPLKTREARLLLKAIVWSSARKNWIVPSGKEQGVNRSSFSSKIWPVYSKCWCILGTEKPGAFVFVIYFFFHYKIVNTLPALY